MRARAAAGSAGACLFEDVTPSGPFVSVIPRRSGRRAVAGAGSYFPTGVAPSRGRRSR